MKKHRYSEDGLKTVPDGGTITLGQYRRERAKAPQVHIVRPRPMPGGDAA